MNRNISQGEETNEASNEENVLLSEEALSEDIELDEIPIEELPI